MIQIVRAYTPEHLEAIRRLFGQYAESLGFDLEFQNFDHELESLPGDYAAPDGCLLLAGDGGTWAGCAALRRLEEKVCEMKRLFVIPGYRGLGVGKTLAKAIIKEARARRYQKMRLDTVASMKEARGLYASLGFQTIEPYRFNPVEGASYMELVL